ncbi:MAG: AAA family ATPase [Rhodobacteraceae bacterium]|nr:AAA family ATPase [Paracoccaceae bacterium]
MNAPAMVAHTPEDEAEFFTAADLAGLPVPPRLWHVPEFIPAHTVTTLNGDGGTGKSLAALQLGAATVMGRPWLGQPVTQGSALFLSAEDDRDELHRRLGDIAEAEGVGLGALKGLTLRSLAGQDALLATPEAGRPEVLGATPLFRRLDAWTARHKPVLVVLDTLADLFGGNEINRAHARQFIGLLRGLALRHGTTVLLLAHPSLSGIATGTGSSGSTGWNNSVRSRLYLRRIMTADRDEPDPDARELEVMKANYGRNGIVIPLRWQAGFFLPDYQSEGALDRLAATAKADRVFLKLLRECDENGRRVNPSGGQNYAPKVFAAHPHSEGISKRAFAAAMERALSERKAAVEQDGPPSRRVTFLVPRVDQ